MILPPLSLLISSPSYSISYSLTASESPPNHARHQSITMWEEQVDRPPSTPTPETKEHLKGDEEKDSSGGGEEIVSWSRVSITKVGNHGGEEEERVAQDEGDISPVSGSRPPSIPPVDYSATPVRKQMPSPFQFNIQPPPPPPSAPVSAHHVAQEDAGRRDGPSAITPARFAASPPPQPPPASERGEQIRAGNTREISALLIIY